MVRERERFSRNNNRGRGGGSRGGRPRSRGRRHSRSPERGSAISGNQRERIAIESGHLVFIDQFMLANPQFIRQLAGTIDQDPAEKNKLIRDFGGEVVELEPGTYRIERDPFAFSIIIHRDGETPEVKSLTRESTSRLGEVFVDTRCLAMVDRELLDDSGLLEKYQQLWNSGQDKACRDLLRDNGGAVRYGFQRQGDDLGIYTRQGEDIVCLWPNAQSQEAAVSAPTE